MSALDTSVPVLLLGGRENALSVARNLGKLGVTIYASAKLGARAMDSKYCKQAFVIPDKALAADHWGELLLETPNQALSGCIVFACCDESLDFLQSNREALQEIYTLEEFIPEQRRIMLNKQATLETAKRIGVPAPSYWEINSDDDVEKIRDEVRLPVMVKPLDSFAFVHEFGAKLFIVDSDFDEVIEKVKLARSRGQDVMVVEMIPGPDNLLTSYYTYRTKDGRRLYDYTKSVIRRWPVNRGGACFHQSQWLPDTAEMGQKLFDGVDWQGIGNVEFKRDTRDGQLKIIEVNARFTAAHRLVTASGAPIDELIYRHLTDQDIPKIESYSNRLRMLYPIGDFMAYLELRQSKQLSFFGWIKSWWAQPVVVPDFSFDDPRPALAEWGNLLSRGFGKITGLFKR